MGYSAILGYLIIFLVLFLGYGLVRGNSMRDTWEEIKSLFTGGKDGG